MFGMGKTKAPDVHPHSLWIAELDKTIAAGKSRHLNLRTMAADLRARADGLAKAAACYVEPRKMHTEFNLPQ